MTRKQAVFTPLDKNNIRMYVCGMTVYDLCHLGHARVMVVFDVIYRYLRARGYQVTYIRNITDIDDKIIKRAAENGESITDLTTRFTRIMNEDSKKLTPVNTTTTSTLITTAVKYFSKPINMPTPASTQATGNPVNSRAMKVRNMPITR